MTAARLAVDRLFAGLSEHPDREAIVFRGRSWSFGELDRLSRRYAGGLADLAIGRGDRVAMFAESAPETIVAMLGHYRLGAIHVPINTRYLAEEAGHILKDSGAKAAVVFAGSVSERVLRDLRGRGSVEREIVIGADRPPTGGRVAFERLLEAPEIPGDPAARSADTALLVYTSGTTGKSKGAALSFEAVVANTEALMALWRLSSSDRLVLALPLFHVHGLCIGLHGALLTGLTLLLSQRFDAREVVRAFEGQGATVFMGVPTMYVKLLELLRARPEAGAALARARLFTAGSAALPAADFEEFERRTGHRILERYGMTETLFTLSNPYEGQRRPGTVGLPVPGCEVRIVEENGEEAAPGAPGEILVRGDSLMTEYWGRPAETAAAFKDGWFATGDVARRDADGYVRIVGRNSVDVIKSGGYKISAREIEDLVATHPGVREVAVVGAPDRVWGERIVAAVVLRDALHTETIAREVTELCGRSLADYKRPKEVRIFEELPRNALGKVQKHRILEKIQEDS